MRTLVALGLAGLSLLVTTASFAEMTPQLRTKFISKCEKQMYETAPVCGCMADIASKTLSDTAIAYLSLDALDPKNAVALTEKMTPKEVASVDKFMKIAPHTCASAH
jgi:hypothetical protein